MNEISQLIVETAAGTVSLLLGVLNQRRLAKRSRELAAQPSGAAALRSIGVQLDAIDAEIEAHTEPELRLQHNTESEYREVVRRMLLDIDDLASQPAPSGASNYEEPFDLVPPATAAADAIGVAYSPHKRARVFLSTAHTFNGYGGSMTILLIGNLGRQHITFSSGASQASIITAIDQFTDVTGVYALQDTVNPDLVRLVSRRRGRNEFVGAGRTYGRPRNAFYDENRSHRADHQVDFGE